MGSRWIIICSSLFIEPHSSLLYLLISSTDSICQRRENMALFNIVRKPLGNNINTLFHLCLPKKEKPRRKLIWTYIYYHTAPLPPPPTTYLNWRNVLIEDSIDFIFEHEENVGLVFVYIYKCECMKIRFKIMNMGIDYFILFFNSKDI